MADDHYLVLARKWRPQRFEDVVGQEHITRTLQNALASGRIGHAFLFIGSRGIGKTTTARILAKALNCEAVDAPTPSPCCSCDNCTTIADGNNIDVVEIDGASNNSVEDVRQIREHIRLVPSRSRFKIYVIDEVHQLSLSAFNALLKTLEEPPAHAVFILATTEAHKVPATIVSRCQRYDFRRVGLDDIVRLLRGILDSEGVACTDEALRAIARAADGGVRDSQSILEQLISYCDKAITFQDVFDVLGLVDWQILHGLCDALEEKNVGRLLEIVEEVVVDGKDLSQFVQDILQYFRNLLVCKTADPKRLLALPPDEVAAMQERAGRFSLTQLIRLVEQFAELTKGFDSQLAQRIALESLLIRIAKVSVEVSLDSVLEKLARLEASSAARPAREPEPNDQLPVAAPAEEESDANPTAPPGPETRRLQPAERIELSEANLDHAWGRIEEAATKDALSLRVWLRQGRALTVEPNGTLVLSFAENLANARDIVEQADNRRRIETALRACTTNVTTFRTELADGGTGPEDEGSAASSCYAGHVDPEAARAALDVPEIRLVLETFRGRIVDIRNGENTHDS